MRPKSLISASFWICQSLPAGARATRACRACGPSSAARRRRCRLPASDCSASAPGSRVRVAPVPAASLAGGVVSRARRATTRPLGCAGVARAPHGGAGELAAVERQPPVVTLAPRARLQSREAAAERIERPGRQIDAVQRAVRARRRRAGRVGAGASQSSASHASRSSAGTSPRIHSPGCSRIARLPSPPCRAARARDRRVGCGASAGAAPSARQVRSRRRSGPRRRAARARSTRSATLSAAVLRSGAGKSIVAPFERRLDRSTRSGRRARRRPAGSSSLPLTRSKSGSSYSRAHALQIAVPAPFTRTRPSSLVDLQLERPAERSAVTSVARASCSVNASVPFVCQSAPARPASELRSRRTDTGR